MLNRRTLIFRSLAYYWPSHLALALGLLVGTAVIAGAFIVGDSVRYSLNRLTLLRLGRVDHILTGPRFFREELSANLQKYLLEQHTAQTVAPALIFSAGLQRTNADTDQTVRANRVNLYGFDQRAWDFLDHKDLPPPVDQEIYLNSRTARQLGAKVGDEIVVSVALPSAVPRDSLLGKKDSTTTQIPFTVKQILTDEIGASRFGIRADQQIPLNAFVPLSSLQSALDLEAERPSRDNPQGSFARVNSILTSAGEPAGQTTEAAQFLTDTLHHVLQLKDLDLRIVPQPKYNYVALESRRMILEPSLVRLAEDDALKNHLTPAQVLVYLANRIGNPKAIAENQDGQKTTGPHPGYSMYSTVAGLDFAADSPFKPDDFIGPSPSFPLQPRDILINEWLASDLNVAIGEEVDLSYYTVGSRGELPELTEKFTVRGILKLDGHRPSDRGLVPDVKGITDAKRLSDWDQPFEMRFNLITQRDEDYWDKYKATPKAFVSLDTAQNLWKSRYGNITSLLLTPPADQPLDKLPSSLESSLIGHLPLADLGLQFQPLKAQGLSASAGTTDFSGLFFGFSLFLIVSASILVGLLFRLGLERRASEVGLWLAVGSTPRTVGRNFFLEHLAVLLVGGILGLFASVVYARIMIYGLTTWWVGAIRTTELQLHVTPMALIAGFSIAFVIAAFSIYRALRRNRLLSLRGLLAGLTTPEASPLKQQRQAARALYISFTTLSLAALLIFANIARLFPSSQAFGGLSWNTVTFFVAGLLILVGMQYLLSWLIATDRVVAVRGSGSTALRRLGLRNAARNRSRTVQTVGLISTATFMIVAVASGQRNPAVELPDKHSGNGGFTLVAEADAPILYDLNAESGRLKLGLNDPDALALLKDVTIVPFRMQPGDNASCLNLYQSQLPTILGVPRQMIERGGFRFVDPPHGNPWTILDQKLPDENVPVLGDMNTLMYSMHKAVGQSIPVDPRRPDAANLQISGMFDGSIFQGVLAMSEDHFLHLFPEQAGFRYFLIDGPVEKIQPLSDLLESRLSGFGFDAERVTDRLADFLSVQNTYLSTFQTLGGLGLLLGTLGLATVMLRNVLERQGELALLQGVGFRRSQLAQLLLWETGALLLWGLASGTLAAICAMAPHLLSTGADVPWASAALTLLAIFVVGMLSSWTSIRAVNNIPVLKTLRAERV